MKKLQNFGIVGAVLAGILCVTPMLVLGLGAFGLGWASGYLDYILIPMIVFFLAIAIYAYLHGRKKLNAAGD